MNISEYKIKEKLQELKNIEGHGTELVSVYLAGEQPVHETVGRLRAELSSSANIKSKTTRDRVQGALGKIINHLKIYGNVAPREGLAVFCGYIPEKEEFQLVAIEPPEPSTLKTYRCGSSFFIEPLEIAIRPKKAYGLVVLDGRDATLATLRGTSWAVHDTVHSLAHSKQGKGGQSKRRFERIREESIEYYYKHIGEKINLYFLGQVEGILVGGPGPAKEDFVKMSPFNYQIKILGVANGGYTDEQGLRELMHNSEDILKGQDAVKETIIVNDFMRELRNNGLVEYGEQQVRDAFYQKRVTKLLVSESYTGRHEFITFADTLGIPVIFISEGTQEGRQFILALHGLGAYVKYAKHKG